MKLEQKAITTIHADEGKQLVRKSDGHIAGESVTLGYNYYEAGIPLSEPHLETPDDYEEQDKPTILDEKVVSEEPIKVDHLKRLKRAFCRKMRNFFAEKGRDAAFPLWRTYPSCRNFLPAGSMHGKRWPLPLCLPQPIWQGNTR